MAPLTLGFTEFVAMRQTSAHGPNGVSLRRSGDKSC
jgi:hypothetical protein